MAASGSAASCSGVEGEAARLRRRDAAEGEPAEVLLPIADMAEAKLVLTDALVTEIAAARQGQGARAGRKRAAEAGQNQRARMRATRITTTASMPNRCTRARTKGE